MSSTARYPSLNIFGRGLQHQPRSVGGRRRVLTCIALVSGLVTTRYGSAAVFETDNFRVFAPNVAAAQMIGRRAEELRATLAQEWLEMQLPRWQQPCVVTLDSVDGRLVGETSYAFSNGRVSRLRMRLSGSMQQVIDTLLPHEVVHTVLASYFQTAIPRWADEGAALTAEDESARMRLWRLEQSRLLSGGLLPIQTLLETREYPIHPDEIRAFYAQGACLTEFLLLAGKSRFLRFVETGMAGGWNASVRLHYGFRDVAELETNWTAWLHQDRPRIALETNQLLAESSHLLQAVMPTAEETTQP